MVLWEITLATAYFLGVKRTYRLALRLQRRLLPNKPPIRAFAQRRTRAVFDVVVKMQSKFQSWDSAAGKKIGGWLLSKSPAQRKMAEHAAKDATTKDAAKNAQRAAATDFTDTSSSAGKLPVPKQQLQQAQLTHPKPPTGSNLCSSLRLDLHRQQQQKNAPNSNSGRLYSTFERFSARGRRSLLRSDIAAFAGIV